MSRINKLLFFLFPAAVFISCGDKLPPGDEGRIIGRWEEAGVVFNEFDSLSYFQWYEFMPKGKAHSYVGDFTYKLDTVKKTLTASVTMVGTDNINNYTQPFFEKNYIIKKDTLIFSRITDKEIRKVLVRKK